MNLTKAVESLTLDDSNDFFDILLNKIDALKDDKIFEPCKSSYLRTFNDMLKRTSNVLNANLSGRINVFFSKLMNFHELSGVNLMKHLNVPNNSDMTEKKADFLNEDLMLELDEFLPKYENKTSEDFANFWKLKKLLRMPESIIKHPENFEFFKTVVSRFINLIGKSYPKNYNWYSDFIPFYSLSQVEEIFWIQFKNPAFQIGFMLEILITFHYYLKTDFEYSKIVTTEQKQWIKSKQTEIILFLETLNPHTRKIMNKIFNSEETWYNWKSKNCFDLQNRPVKLDPCLPTGSYDEIVESGRKCLNNEECGLSDYLLQQNTSQQNDTDFK